MANTNPIEVVRVHIWVTGRVQNVGVRAFVQQSGALFGLTGWVRNVGDDQVEAVAEGSRPAAEKFIAALRTGPRVARVDEARLEWEAPTGEFPDFGVKYSVY
jgi:acylphosphatase